MSIIDNIFEMPVHESHVNDRFLACFDNLYSAYDISDYIIYKCNTDTEFKTNITNARLQKILYFIQVQFLIELHKPCFYDNIVAWGYGPVIPNIHTLYYKYTCMPLPAPIMGSTYFENKITPEKDRKLIEQVILYCNQYSNVELNNIIQEQQPWQIAYNNMFDNTVKLDDIWRAFISNKLPYN